MKINVKKAEVTKPFLLKAPAPPMLRNFLKTWIQKSSRNWQNSSQTYKTNWCYKHEHLLIYIFPKSAKFLSEVCFTRENPVKTKFKFLTSKYFKISTIYNKMVKDQLVLGTSKRFSPLSTYRNDIFQMMCSPV